MTVARRAIDGLRVVELSTVARDGSIEFRIQKILRSPNEYLGMHWREKHRERKAWEAALTNAIVISQGVPAARALLGPGAALRDCVGACRVRRRVEVIRLAPSRRNFVRDDDNLRFAVKPLLDALKRVGLIKDDRRQWIDLPVPTQDVSPDGCFWTWIALTAAEAATT